MIQTIDKGFKMVLMHFIAKYIDNNPSEVKDFAFMGAILALVTIKDVIESCLV